MYIYIYIYNWIYIEIYIYLLCSQFPLLTRRVIHATNDGHVLRACRDTHVVVRFSTVMTHHDTP